MNNLQGITLDQFSDWEQLLLALSAGSPPLAAPAGQLTCEWVEESGTCGSTLFQDPKVACLHFRNEHGIRGREKEMAICCWDGCGAVPMQRGSLIRHILAVHLRTLRWTCPLCGKTFSRRDTAHQCLGA
ncbi:hypothetical protein PAXRUDRAFT_258504 [Paxillus rubicundulus Ve08.2h10]|uniref:C2H2-type domain-containing protein n=1 Tax=Paxillus rubicundulus Ve08.2h10 TaxID=930991 RepID=A0A0D0EB16_9AGAM|nr:hypothetical protein PAXRUDRAFT_258504 [Paxillus rubicundulus Ve08.2h10]